MRTCVSATTFESTRMNCLRSFGGPWPREVLKRISDKQMVMAIFIESSLLQTGRSKQKISRGSGPIVLIRLPVQFGQESLFTNYLVVQMGHSQQRKGQEEQAAVNEKCADKP